MINSTVRDELTQYAVDTKHRAHQYETPEQISHMLRKMIASHVRVVPWGDVYSHVSPSDYKRVMKRIEPVDLGDRVAPPAEFYVDLSQQVQRLSEPRAQGIFDAFSEHIYPELKKSPYERSDESPEKKKKALALFLSQATEGDTRQVVNLLYPKEEDVRERERVYDAILSYGSLKHEYDTNEAVAEELGYFLRTMYFPNVENGKIYIVEPLQNQQQRENAMCNQAPVSRVARLTPTTIEWRKREERDRRAIMHELDQNKSVQTWKQQHALNPMFPSHKAAKQMLMQMHSKHQKQQPSGYLLGSEVLGKYQNVEDLLDKERAKELIDEADVAQAYKTLLSGASEYALNAMMDTPQVRSFIEDLIDDTPRAHLEKLTQQDVLSLFMQANREKGLSQEFISKLIAL